jgi:hypothetical protein
VKNKRKKVDGEERNQSNVQREEIARMEKDVKERSAITNLAWYGLFLFFF